MLQQMLTIGRSGLNQTRVILQIKSVSKITEVINHQVKNMVWVQKNDDVDIHLDNGQSNCNH
jgi:hypothetical protein